jgi:prepilin-type N-terminal cleavage/methylation domain-containing protein
MPEGPHDLVDAEVQRGSTLVEVLVALAMGGVVAASVHGFHASAVEAMERVADRRAATWTAVADAELRAVSRVPFEHLAGEDGGWTDPGRVLALRRDDPVPDDVGAGACPAGADSVPVPRGRTDVVVEPRNPVERGGAVRPPTTVALDGALARPASASRRVERRVVDAQGVPIPGVELRVIGPVPATTTRIAVTDASGCAVIGDLEPGDHHVALVAPGLLDGAHVALDERPPVLVGLGLGDDVALERLAPGAEVRVEVAAPAGARLPDTMSVPTLRWTVLDDDRRVALAPGQARTLQAGMRTLVLGVCGAAEAGGSRQRIEVAPGASHVVAVPLAVVRLEATAGYEGSTVHAQRAAPCLDGTTARPWLRWSGVVTEGVVLALPAGTWVLEVRSAGGSVLAVLGADVGTIPVVLRLGS